MIFNTIVLPHVNTTVLEKANILVLNSCMKLGQRIAIARKHAKLSQEELALRVGCTQGLISKLERGDQDETGLIVKIAKETGVNPIWLDSEEGTFESQNNYPISTELEYHLKVMQNLPDYARTEVIRDAIKTAELIKRAKADKNGTDSH